MTAPCELLEWDTQFFGRRIARATARTLTPPELEAVDRWCAEHRVDCLYWLSKDEVMVDGFVKVDERVTMEAATGGDGAAGVRPWRPEDLAALKAIAASAHRDTRFYHDGRFPKEQCDALYATWIERSCQGWAEAVFVAEAQGRAAGYISCHSGREGKIGLVGVGEAARGRGLGGALVRGALRWFADGGMARASVVTQGRNDGAKRLYEKCGFKVRTVEHWYHRWFSR